MKASIHFQKEIQSYLEQRAEYDELFARSYRNPLKNIEDCVTYILNYVQKAVVQVFPMMRFLDKQFIIMTKRTSKSASLSTAK